MEKTWRLNTTTGLLPGKATMDEDHYQPKPAGDFGVK